MSKICEIPDCSETKNLIEGYIPDDNNRIVWFCKKHYKMLKKVEMTD